MSEKTVNVIGAGLAGSEAAWQLANRGVHVRLYEMRPVKKTPAHHTDKFAELVCSNSLRANSLTNAVGVLKEEMRRLNSVIIQAADACAVPAGSALAVDRLVDRIGKTVVGVDCALDFVETFGDLCHDVADVADMANLFLY